METLQERERLISMPRMGYEVPKFKVKTTHDEVNFLDEYAGKWIVLFSHPADFTPLCATDFITFTHQRRKFSMANCQLVGFAIDELYNYIVGLRTIKNSIEFNGIKNIEIAKKYGIIQPGESKTQAVRTVFIIDPNGMTRASIYYNLSLGRNFDEIYRALVEMQTADAINVGTPADWNPGHHVIVSPAISFGVAEEGATSEGSLDCKDWLYCTKKLDKDEVLKTIPKKQLSV